MSVKVMSAVFERYPNGGGEMLLALALADHAHDDGTHVFPKVETLAEKTRQSVRSVQYQLRLMEASGWLILVNSGKGGRNYTREYRICSDWIKGAEIAPLKKGANDDDKGCNLTHKGCKTEQERVQTIAPAYNHQEPSLTIKESLDDKPATPTKPNSKVGLTVDALVAKGVDEQVALDWLSVRRDKGSKVLSITALKAVEREATAAGLSLCEAIKVSIEFNWIGFRAAWYASRHRANAPPATRTTNTPRDYTKGIDPHGRF
ncbi:helix-turn-helix domain-containing protein [Hydromonas duriensis]|uniref:Helix-turn-helix protein n=1 Tax=Hydromonas duriensis TaxID=1527608 RepID=A0A4R6Y2D1_9BURK|nr:helix-turn-helix domain-containing protein [Hydromonas duriensis]TDR30663.1 helix-turn-helix protein [Hydromonas duriensis]